MEFCNYNGKIIKEATELISPNSRGFRFGDGVFETMKSKDNKIYFAEDHFNRLINGLKTLEFKVPRQFTADNLIRQIEGILKKNNHARMARIRLTAFRGDGGLYDEISDNPNYLIQTWALPDDIGKWNENGLVLGICTGLKKSCDSLSNLKHNNFLPYVMAAKQAKDNKWNDAVMLNSFDRICDTTIANIFLIKNEVVYTPALQEGCVAGIMRKNILQQLATNKVTVIEKEISVDDLMEADELFLTNSIYNIRWVQNIGNKKYKNSFTQKIRSSLHTTIL